MVEGCDVVEVLRGVELCGAMEWNPALEYEVGERSNGQDASEGGVEETASVRAKSLECNWVVGGVPMSADLGIHHRGRESGGKT